MTCQNGEVQRNCDGLQLKVFKKRPNENISGERMIGDAMKIRQEEVNDPQDGTIEGDFTINNDFPNALNGKLPHNGKNTAWKVNSTLGKEHSGKSVPPVQWRRTVQERPCFKRQNVMLRDRRLTRNDEHFEEDCQIEASSDEEPAAVDLTPSNKPDGQKSVMKNETQRRDICRGAEEFSTCLIPPPSPAPGNELFKKPQCPPQRLLLRESLIDRRVFRNVPPPPSPCPSVRSSFDLELMTAARKSRRSPRRSGKDVTIAGRPGKPLGRLLNNTGNQFHGNGNTCPGICNCTSVGWLHIQRTQPENCRRIAHFHRNAELSFDFLHSSVVICLDLAFFVVGCCTTCKHVKCICQNLFSLPKLEVI